MYVGTLAIAAVVAAASMLTACGERPVGITAWTAPASETATPVANLAVPPPNAQGNPACPGSTAWGRDPSGVGVLVTYWSDGPGPVTVLVRTATGTDRAQRDMVVANDLRLFEFPDVDSGAVREVLLMTNTKRCFVQADSATFG